MRRAGTIVLAVVCLFALLCAPGRAYAQDELKNDDPDKYYILLDVRNQIVTVYERDAEGEYTKIVPHELIEYSFGERAAVVRFTEQNPGVVVTVTFDGEPTHSEEQQRTGWQAILDNFARHVKGKAASQ